MKVSLLFVLSIAACGDDDAPAVDAGADAATDQDSGSEPSGLWEGCPTADDFIGPSSGATTVTATDDAIYCVMFNESQTFAEAYASKAMLKIAPGNYPFGTQSGVDMLLPTCIRSGGTTHPSVTMPGELAYNTAPFEGQTDHGYNWTNRVQNGGVFGFLETRFDINVEGSNTPSMTLDGNDVPAFAYENIGRHSFYFCQGDPLTDCGRALIVDSCAFDSASLHRHTLTLGAGNSAGNVTFDLRIGQSPASTEPGAFVRARGAWNGQAFDQRDYFKLVYVPAHHHFQRNFIVLFDAPIGGACGLRVSGISQYEEELDQGEAATVNCDLADIASIDITDHTHTLVE